LTVSASTTESVQEHTMHTTFTTDIARELVSNHLREADTRRRVRLVRRGRRSAQASVDGTGTTERVTRRAARPAPLTSDVIGAC
jgi:hypothetical protein